MKTKRTFYNSIASLFYYFLTILLGIVNRRAVIIILGIEYQGINGLFSNVLSMLSIAELGIGTAIIYHLYKPLAENRIDEIQSIMYFYRKCYWFISAVIFFLGILIIPLLPFIVTENELPFSLGSIYIWFLLDSVVSYLFTYKRSIIIADQQNYIVVSCDILYQLFVKTGQIIILWLSHNFMWYLSVMVAGRFLENLLINVIANKKYPYLISAKASPLPKEILNDIYRKVHGTVFHKIGAFIVLGIDNILIVKFLGLTIAGIYSNYFLIINSVQNICYQIVTAATASVGHIVAENDKIKIFSIFNELQLLNTALLTWISSGIYCVATPVIALLFGEDYILSDFTLLILSVNLYMQGMRAVFSIFKETAGILYEDRFVPLWESIINLAASLLFLQKFGLAGIFMGTILSSLILYLYTYPILVYKKVLGRTVREYYREFLWISVLGITSIFCSKAVCSQIVLENRFSQIAIYTFISSITAWLIFILAYALWKRESIKLIVRIKNIFSNT